MNKTVFEAHGEELIARAGMTKAEFARRMGIKRQNVKSLFRSPKLETVQKAALVLNLPLVYLIGYVDPIDYSEEPFNIQSEDIQPEVLAEDKKVEQQLIEKDDREIDFSSVGKTFRHFKGNRYKVLAIAKHSETTEPMVVYQALYGDGDVWVRPYEMFFGTVDRDGIVRPRFEEE